MILRRFMKHVTDQNWFAVGLDVLVVIVGIFLGLQVQNWYEDQAKRAEEQVYLERLHSDVTSVVSFQENIGETRLVDRLRKEFSARLSEVIDVLGGFDNSIKLGPNHCMAIIISHTYNTPNNSLSTLNELISSGQFSIFTNDNIKVSLSEFLQSTETILRQLDHLNSVSLVIARKYPKLVKWNISAGAARFRQEVQHICDFEKMVDNDAFLNDLADNYAKQQSFETGIVFQQQALEKLHDHLDVELGITH